MSEEIDDGDVDMMLLKRFSQQKQTVAHTVRDRMIRENQPIPVVDARRVRYGDGPRTAQLNLKVSQEFRDRVLALAAAEGIPNVVLVQRAIDLYARQKRSQ
jgi:hypothetical protein